MYLPSNFPSKVDIIQVGEYTRISWIRGVGRCWIVFFEAGSSGNRGAFQVWRTDSGGASNDQNNGISLVVPDTRISSVTFFEYYVCNAF